MQKKIILSLLVGVLLSAGMLYLAFRNVPLADIYSYLKNINYIWIAPSMALIVLAFVLRVVRWQLILKEAADLSFWKAFHPLMIGFMMNCILPGRVGELARPAILKKESQVPMTTGLATVAVERIFDIVMMIALFAISFNAVTSQPDMDVRFGGWHLNAKILQSVAWGMIRLSIVLLIGLSLFAFSMTRRWMMRALNTVVGVIGLAGPRIKNRAEQANYFLNILAEGFANGLSLVGKPGRALACVLLTILIWAVSILSYYVFAMGCPGINLSFMEMTTVMVVICFFIALPSAPGFWGLWEAGGVFALALFGVATKDAAGFTLVNHAVNMFPIVVIGLISALVTSVNFWQLTYGAKTGSTLTSENPGSAVREPS